MKCKQLESKSQTQEINFIESKLKLENSESRQNEMKGEMIRIYQV